MDGAYFLVVAQELCEGSSEAHQRSAVSRAYYSAFHAVVGAFDKHGILIPSNATGHEKAVRYLNNCNDQALAKVGTNLGTLRTSRNTADYRMHKKVTKFTAKLKYEIASQLIREVRVSPLGGEDAQEVVDAIRNYQRLTGQT